MTTKFWLVLLALAVVAFGACNGAQETVNTNGNENVAAEPAKDLEASISELEKSAYDAWQKKDGKFFEGFLADNYVSVGRDGRGNKEMSVKSLADNPCEIKSFTKSDGELVELGENIALYTSKDTLDVSCDGKTLASPNWVASLYVKDGDKWMAAYHQSAPAADAKGENPPTPEGATDKPGEDSDKAITETLMAPTKSLWDAWSKHDTKPFEEALTEKYVSINTGNRVDRAGKIKLMGTDRCEVKSIAHDAARSMKLSDTIWLLTYKTNVDGVCDGTALPKAFWSADIWVKDGDNWKNQFWMGTPGA